MLGFSYDDARDALFFIGFFFCNCGFEVIIKTSNVFVFL